MLACQQQQAWQPGLLPLLLLPRPTSCIGSSGPSSSAALARLLLRRRWRQRLRLRPLCGGLPALPT
jgi:hypothetical protein